MTDDLAGKMRTNPDEREGLQMKRDWSKSVKLGVAILALLLGGVSQTQALPLLFGSTSGDSPSSLYHIDPSSGAATLVGPIGFNSVSAMDFNPLGVLYGVGVSGVSVLLTINTTTGAGTVVGPTGLGSNFTQDITFRNGDGTLYAYSDGNIYTINTTTGAATLVGSTGLGRQAGNALAFSALDTLYNANQANLLTVNQTTGLETVITGLSYPIAESRANGMDFDNSTGILWASATSGNANYLATIDTGTGIVTEIGPTARLLDALAVQPAQPVGVPEPGSLALLLVGGLSIARMLRRR